jgi:hypothetical protein
MTKRYITFKNTDYEKYPHIIYSIFLCYSCTTANKSKYLEFEDSKLEVQEKQVLNLIYWAI